MVNQTKANKILRSDKINNKLIQLAKKILSQRTYKLIKKYKTKNADLVEKYTNNTGYKKKINITAKAIQKKTKDPNIYQNQTKYIRNGKKKQKAIQKQKRYSTFQKSITNKYYYKNRQETDYTQNTINC